MPIVLQDTGAGLGAGDYGTATYGAGTYGGGAGWLSGLAGLFYIEQITLTFTPNTGILTAQWTLFDAQQGLW